MVDENLIKELKEMREKGPSKPSDALKMYEFVKQMVDESEDLKEELDDIDTMVVQLIVTDFDYKYWVKLGDGAVDYGEGDGDDPVHRVQERRDHLQKVRIQDHLLERGLQPAFHPAGGVFQDIDPAHDAAPSSV